MLGSWAEEVDCITLALIDACLCLFMFIIVEMQKRTISRKAIEVYISTLIIPAYNRRHHSSNYLQPWSL